MMNATQTLEQMKQLRLQGMYQAYNAQLELPMNQQLQGHDLIAYLVQSEEQNRCNEKTAYYLKRAKLRLPVTIKQIDCSPGRNLTKQRLAVLTNNDYINQGKIS
jgi:hypothetical protein